MKKPIIMVSLIALLLTGAASVSFFDTGLSDNEDENTSIRTVEYNDKSYLDENDFKETKTEETDFGIVFSAVKSFNSSLFNKIDFVSQSKNEEIDVTFEVTYFESQGRVLLDVYELNGTSKTNLLETMEGLITPNEDGEPDVFFADEEETILLSQLLEQTSIDNVGWWDSLVSWIKGVANAIKDVVVSALRLLTYFTVKIVGLDGAAKVLCMSKDSNGIYHANFNCWQAIFGYNNLYDYVFDLGTTMLSKQFEFYDENNDGLKDYVLWARKGDYWELGFGAELGIYRRLGITPHWYVDKNLAIDMTLKVDYRTSTSSSWKTIIDWDPSQAEGYSDKQWWITGFNPKYANKAISSANLLRATYTIKFETLGYSSKNTKLRNNFKSTWVNSSNWSYNSSTTVFTYSF